MKNCILKLTGSNWVSLRREETSRRKAERTGPGTDGTLATSRHSSSQTWVRVPRSQSAANSCTTWTNPVIAFLFYIYFFVIHLPRLNTASPVDDGTLALVVRRLYPSKGMHCRRIVEVKTLYNATTMHPLKGRQVASCQEHVFSSGWSALLGK